MLYTGNFFVYSFYSNFYNFIFYYLFWKQKNPSISYYQDFIRKREFVGKKVTLGFNVSDDWKDQVIFTLYNQDDEILDLSKCDENLTESENLTYYCIINYSIEKNNLSSYSLKLHLNLTRKVEKKEKFPFLFLWENQTLIIQI